MTIPITGQPPVPGLDDPATFNTKALNLFTWITGSMLDQFNNVDAADFFGVQSGPLDTGAGKVLQPGAFGLGATTAAPLLADLNAQSTPAGLYRYAAATTGTKPAGIAADGMVLVLRGKDSTSFIQHLYSGQGIGMHTRACVTGSFLSWKRVYTGDDASADPNLAGVDPTKLATRATIATAIAATPSPVKAWVNFNGTGTVSIRASMNVSSITDLGVGHYRINIATAPPDEGYSLALACRNEVNGGDTAINVRYLTTPTRSRVTISCASYGFGQVDPAYVYAQLFW